MSKESKAILICHGSYTIRAGYGINTELFQRPSVEVRARVGLPQTWVDANEGAEPTANDYLVGKALDDAEVAGEVGRIVWPIQKEELVDLTAATALWRHVLFTCFPVRLASNDSYVLLSLPVPCLTRAMSAQITQTFFETFNVAGLMLSEAPLLSAYAAGTLTAAVVDLGWEACSVTLVLECAVQHSATVSTGVGAKHCIAYLAHLLRRNANIVNALASQPSVGAGSGGASRDLDAHLYEALFALAQQLLEQGHVAAPERDDGPTGAGGLGDDDDQATFDVATALVEGREKEAIEEQQRKMAESAQTKDASATAREEDEAITVNFRGKNLRVGAERFRFVEPLVDPSVLEGVRGGSLQASTLLSIPEAIATSIAQLTDQERRSTLWESLLLTGAPSRIPNLFSYLTQACATFVARPPPEEGALGAVGSGPRLPNAATADQAEANAVQSSNVRFLRVPDYFAEFKDRTDLAPFLGATISAKLVFGDPFSKLCVTKTTYNERGPAAGWVVSN